MTSDNRLSIDSGMFYHMTVNDSEELFKNQEDAVEYLRDQADDINPEDPDVQLARVETGEEWSIEGVPWQNIALQLL